MKRVIAFLLFFHLLYSCDSFYGVVLINNTGEDVSVRIKYESLDEYWRKEILESHNNIELSLTDTLSFILVEDASIVLGSNAGISNYYVPESLFCSFLEIKVDSLTITAYGKDEVFRLLSFLGKGARKGERLLTRSERLN